VEDDALDQTDVSVIVPAKNEKASIEHVVSQIARAVPGAEIIVVDDGSDDGTGELARDAGARVIRHPYSKGNGAAVKTGARNARGQILVFMDADGQHDAEDIKKLLGQVRDGYDLSVGARSKGSQASVGRGVANGFYNKLASYMTGHTIKDLTSGFRAVRATKFREFLYLLPNGFSYPTTSTMAFFRAGYSVAYVPIHAARRIGKSHIRLVRDGMRFLLIIFKIGTLYSPLKLFAPIAALLFAMATLWYGYTFASMGRFTNMSALLYTGSVMIFLMGLISEQITELMYKEKQ
jgi:glycosyltransferase involved in cell wall biosynthesis